MCLLDLFQGMKGGGPLKLHEPVWVDFCWEVQILKKKQQKKTKQKTKKNRVTIEIKNSLQINLSKP